MTVIFVSCQTMEIFVKILNYLMGIWVHNSEANLMLAKSYWLVIKVIKRDKIPTFHYLKLNCKNVMSWLFSIFSLYVYKSIFLQLQLKVTTRYFCDCFSAKWFKNQILFLVCIVRMNILQKKSRIKIPYLFVTGLNIIGLFSIPCCRV